MLILYILKWGELPPTCKGESQRKLETRAVKQVIENFLAYLSSDVRAAREYGVPLGTSIPAHERLLQRSGPPTIADVAFQLSLPVLTGLPARTLVEIRRDEAEHFSRFKSRLRLAIEEKIKAAGKDNASSIAADIQRDLIQPELDNIQARLTAAQGLLAKKSAVAVFLGALASTCGLLAGLNPALAISGGVGTAITFTGHSSSKYLEQQHDIQLNDMYFAWRAQQHIEH